jgi:hypothetical protein
MPRSRKPAVVRPTPEEFLADYSPQIQELAHALRRLILDSVPNVAEAVYPGWRLIGYRQLDRPGGRYFAFVAPLPAEVRLGFEYGVALNDPYGLLEGAGSQVRHVVVRAPENLRPELAPLITEAALVANTRSSR